jgi:hypothetical protein
VADRLIEAGTAHCVVVSSDGRIVGVGEMVANDKSGFVVSSSREKTSFAADRHKVAQTVAVAFR